MQLGFRWALRLAQDARFAVRHFRGAPSYAIFTILVLALGIGTVTAMFTIAYAVLWKPLPFQADRGLFQPIDRTNKDDGSLSISSDEMRQWQLATKNTADVAFNGGGLNVAEGPGGAVLITEVEASPNLFSVLGTQPTLGRTFHQEEQATDHSDVAVISDAIWRETFGADRAVIGKTLHIGPNVYSVIGVMPPHFEYPLYDDRPEVWVPLDRSELAAANIDSYAFFAPLVRVHSGVSPQVAEAQLTIAHMPFAKIKASDIHLESVRDLLVADVRPAMLALEVAVGVVWLIACSNVAGLMLARVRTRRAEIAVRAALGAGRRRILAQLLSESLLLSCVGAVGGLALAVLLLRIFRHMAGTMLPLASNIQFSWVVWTGLLALTAVTAFVFGVVPAFMRRRQIRTAACEVQAASRQEIAARPCKSLSRRRTSGAVYYSFDWCRAHDANHLCAEACAARLPQRPSPAHQPHRAQHSLPGPQRGHRSLATAA